MRSKTECCKYGVFSYVEDRARLRRNFKEKGNLEYFPEKVLQLCQPT